MRLVRAVFVVLLVWLWLFALFASDARAEGSVGVTTTQGTYYTDSLEGANSPHYSSWMAACYGGIAWINGQGGHYNYNNGAYEQVQFYFQSGNSCVWSGVSYGDSGSFGIGSGTGAITGCPPNSSNATSTSCTCASGYVPDSGSCSLAANVCSGYAAGLSSSTKLVWAAGSSGSSQGFCNANCTMTSTVTGSDSSGAYFSGPFKATGGTCSGLPASAPPAAVAPAASSPQANLSPGNCPGAVNGVAVPGGVPCDSVTSSTGSQTTQGASSSASAASGASNGTSQDSTTTCTGGQCTTTTTTTTTANGTTTTGTSTTTQSAASFCQLNPADPQCNKQSSFSGDCSSGFVCSGDGVQCAIAEVEWRQACYFGAGPSATTQGKYTALTAQNGQQATGAWTSNQSVANMLPAAPAAICSVQDLSIPFGVGAMAMSLPVPLGTYLCPKLAVIRGVIVAFGSLMFILIVFVRN